VGQEDSAGGQEQEDDRDAGHDEHPALPGGEDPVDGGSLREKTGLTVLYLDNLDNNLDSAITPVISDGGWRLSLYCTVLYCTVHKRWWV
jgi:hypothetical protein